MADGLPRADESRRGSRAWVRDWLPYDRYQSVHQSSINSLTNQGLVQRDSITFREVRAGDGSLAWVNVRGRIECSADVLISVNKWLQVRSNRQRRAEVKGKWYAYTAWIRARPRRLLLRYDNSHGEDELHRHFFDDSGHEVAIEPIALATLPRLDLLVREAVALARGTPLEEIYAD